MRDLWTRRIASLVLGGLIGVYTPESARFIVLGVFVLLGVRLVLWKPRDFFGPMVRAEIMVLMMGVFVGTVYGFTGSQRIEPPFVLDRVQVTGELLDWSVNEDGATGIFQVLDPIPEFGTVVQKNAGQVKPAVPDKKYRLKVYLNSEGELPAGWQTIQPGDVIQFTGKLEHPKPPGTAGQFNLPLYFAVRGFAGSITAQGDAELMTPGNPPLRWVVLTHIRELIERISSTQTGRLEGILFGDTGRIPEEDLERYQITGVYHVFSASGSNVAFLLALCWGGLKFLPIPLRAGISMLVLSFYALLCGGNPPILRATVMGIFILVGKVQLGRLIKGGDKSCEKDAGTRSSLRNLFLAALLLFLWQPLNLKDIGFQLSFLATWGILVLSPRLVAIRGIRRLPQPLKIALATTAAAQMATLPLLITAFHRLSLIGLLANIAVLFLMGSIFEIGMIGAVFSFLPIVALPLFQVSLWLLGITSDLLFQLARVPLADVWVINPGIPFWIVWYGGILSILWGWGRVKFTARVWGANVRKGMESLGERLPIRMNPFRSGEFSHKGAIRLLNGLRLLNGFRLLDRFRLPNSAFLKDHGITAERMILVLIVLLFLWSPWNTPRVLEVTVIDVGQGDSILIETPKGSRILVDTGPKTDRFDAGERIIVPYLLSQGIKHLDAIILTHSHADHVGGAAAVLETIPVDWVGIPDDGQDWFGGKSAGSVGSAMNAGGAGNVEDGGGSARNSYSYSPWLGEVSGLDPKLQKILANHDVMKLTAGDRIQLDSDSLMDVLAPGEILSGTHSDENNNSIVLRLKNRAGQSVLLTGDMEEEEMKEILKGGQDFTADVFKVPHHGSRFSLDRDWLDRIDPHAVVISVGKNTFGHPNPGVLKYWEERHVPIYRTDEDGTLRVRMDERRIEVIPGRT